MRNVPFIACAAFLTLAACEKQPTFPASGNHTPVNEAAMPTPEATGTAILSGSEPAATGTAPSPAITPGTPPPTLLPTHIPPAARPKPDA